MSNSNTPNTSNYLFSSKDNHVSSSVTKSGAEKVVQVFSQKQNYIASESESLQRNSCRLSSRNAPARKVSPERKSPSTVSQSQSPNLCHTDKVPVSRCNIVPATLRPCFADALIPSYLTGQWSKDVNTSQLPQSDGAYVCDKSAQTVEHEVRAGGKTRGHKKSASYDQGDPLQLQFIKQQLQKSKEGSKCVDGKHWASPTASSRLSLAATGAPKVCLQKSRAARILPMQKMNRYQRNSVEGLNMEIEKLVSSITSSAVAITAVADVFKYEIPEGHRAPGPEPTHVVNTVSVVTQTPGQLGDHSLAVSFGCVNRSASASPGVPLRPASPGVPLRPASPGVPLRPASVDIHHMTKSRCNSCDGKYGRGDTESSPESITYLFSPHVKQCCPFVHEPPHGCNKVTVLGEFSQPKINEDLHFSPVTPNMFVFKPSQGSAFCPLMKKYEYPHNYTSSSSTMSSGLLDE